MKFSKEIKIGLLALISGSILYFGVNFLKGVDFLSSSTTYYTIYNDINGLSVSNQVLVNGFSVGRVSDIEIIQGKNTTVKVGFEVNNEILVGKDAKAVLIDTDLLGGKAIKLLPGNYQIKAEPYDTIEGVIEKSLTKVFADKAMPVVEDLDSTIQNINTFLKSYTFASKEIQQMFIQAKNLLSSSQKILDENRMNLKSISGNLSETTREFKKSSKDVSNLLANASQFSDSLSQLEINRTLESLNRTLEKMDSISSQIASGEGTMGKMIYNDSLYNNLNAVSRDLDKLLIDLQEHPKRYVHFSIFGKKDK